MALAGQAVGGRAVADLVHASAFEVGGRAALIRGPSGSGKSDLVLRCLAVSTPPFASSPPVLVADDQVIVEPRDGRLMARCPAPIAGLLEVRGVGILRLAHTAVAEIALVADLTPGDAVERLPDPAGRVELAGIAMPMIRLDPFEASAPLKLLLALATANPGAKVEGIVERRWSAT